MPSVINSDNGVISGTSGLKTSGSNDGLLDFQSNGTRIAGITTSAFQVGTDNVSAVNSMGFRNRIINGDMRIDQRNAGASVSFAASSSGYTVDRMQLSNVTDGAWTAQRSTTTATGFTNSLLLTVTTADASLGATQFASVQQLVEGFNVADLGWGTANAQTVTLSFWVRSSLTGTFGGAFVNSAQNRSYPFTYTINSANTFEYKTVTVAGDTSGTWLTDNGIGVRIYFGLGVGATYSGTSGAWAGSLLISATGATSVVGTNGATFYITGVQLEAGSVATPFERRAYGTELALCQRYYEKSYNQATVPGTATGDGYSLGCVNSNASTTYYSVNIDKFAVVKRAAPTMRFWDIAGNINRVSSYTLGGLVRTDNSNSVLSYSGFQQNAVMIDTRNAATMAGYQWDASIEL